MFSHHGGFNSLFKIHSDVAFRELVHVDSPDMLQLCSDLKKAVFTSFYKSRNKTYFDQCCWSFCKPGQKNSHEDHDCRLLLNNYFKAADLPYLETKIKIFLLEQGRDTPYLQDGKMVIPFINRQHPQRTDSNIFQHILRGKTQEFQAQIKSISSDLRAEIRKRQALENQLDEVLAKRGFYQQQIHSLKDDSIAKEERISLLETKFERLLQRIDQAEFEADHSSEKRSITSDDLHYAWGTLHKKTSTNLDR